jgi:hypothetical protein
VTAYQDAYAMSVQMSTMAFLDEMLALMLSATPFDDLIPSASYSAAPTPEKPHLAYDIPAVLDDFDENELSADDNTVYSVSDDAPVRVSHDAGPLQVALTLILTFMLPYRQLHNLPWRLLRRCEGAGPRCLRRRVQRWPWGSRLWREVVQGCGLELEAVPCATVERERVAGEVGDGRDGAEGRADGENGVGWSLMMSASSRG